MKAHYESAVYWKLPDDGEKFKCVNCKEQFKHTEVILTQIPKDDSRSVLCLDCVDSWWIDNAVNLGMFKD